MELPRTDRGNRYVLDFLAKWSQGFPMQRQCITELLVHEVIPPFGVSEALLSDRDTNLLSHLMCDICALLAITHHPQCDGMVEPCYGSMWPS